MVAYDLLVGAACAALLVIPVAGASEGALQCGRSGRCASEGFVLLQAKRRMNKSEQFLMEDVLGKTVTLSPSSSQQEGEGFLRTWPSRVASALTLLMRSQFSQPGNAPAVPIVVGPGAVPPASPTPASMLEIAQYALISGTVYVLFILALGFLYKKIKEAPNPELMEQQQESHGFQFGIFDTTKCSLGLVFWSCCCCPLRWADTVSSEKLKLIGFWPALVTVALLIGFGTMPFIGRILSIVLLGIVMYSRQSIRAHYKLDKGTFMTLLEDCLCYACCGPCVVAQEARQVEYVEAKQ